MLCMMSPREQNQQAWDQANLAKAGSNYEKCFGLRGPYLEPFVTILLLSSILNWVWGGHFGGESFGGWSLGEGGSEGLIPA
jgi:hypothetical protein